METGISHAACSAVVCGSPQALHTCSLCVQPILQVPNWSSLGRLKRSRFPNLGGGGHQFGGGAGAGALSGVLAAGSCAFKCVLCMAALAWHCIAVYSESSIKGPALHF